MEPRPSPDKRLLPATTTVVADLHARWCGKI